MVCAPSAYSILLSHAAGLHAFNSVDAAGYIGAGVEKQMGWKVNLKHFALELFVDITQDSVVMGIALTKVSPHLPVPVHVPVPVHAHTNADARVHRMECTIDTGASGWSRR